MNSDDGPGRAWLSRWALVLVTAIAPFIWGSTYIVTTQFLPSGRPLTAAAIRAVPAGLILLAFARQLPRRQEWGRLFLVAMLNIGAYQALLFVAAYRLPGGLASLLGAIQPLLVMLWAWMFDAERPRRWAIAGAVLGVLGTATLLTAPTSAIDGIGVAAALASAALMSVGVWLTRRWRFSIAVTALTGWQLLLGGLVLAPLALGFEPPLPALTGLQVAAYAYLSLAGALVAYWLWFRGLTRLPAVAGSSLALLSPVTAVLLGWSFLDQAMHGLSFVGLVAVLLGIALVQRAAASAPVARGGQGAG